MDGNTPEEEETVGLLFADTDGISKTATAKPRTVMTRPSTDEDEDAKVYRSDGEVPTSTVSIVPPSRQFLLLFLCAVILIIVVRPLAKSSILDLSDRVDHHFDNSSNLMTSTNISAVIHNEKKTANNKTSKNIVVPLALLDVAKFAASVNNSYCGPNHEQPTNISQVAAFFGLLEPYLLEHNSASDGGKSTSLVRTIAVPFQAYDSNGIKRTLGGDEFLVTVSGWSTTTTDDNNLHWKTTAVARDASNGIYVVHLEIPALRNAVLHEMTLVHYYTCYQGFTRTSKARAQKYYYQIDLGPISVEPSPTFSELVQSVASSADPSFELAITTSDPKQRLVMVQSLPECQYSQLGVDQSSQGLWIDQTRDLIDGDCTGEAKWFPTICRPPTVVGGGLLRLDSKTTFQLFRVGDSTMPPAGGNNANKWNIGDPFSADYKSLAHHDVYVDILKNRLPESEATDVLVLGHGLHQIFRGFNIQTAVDSVVRMLCQMATVFPGRLVVQAPVPIQQQLFYKVDQTDTNVNLFKAILRERMSAVDARLADLCQNTDLDVFYSAPSTTGDFAPLNETLRAFENAQQYSPALNASNDEKELTRYFRGLSSQERQSIWGDRRVVYANVAHLMRPRPECYRDHDKIHALRGVNGHGYMMDFGHGELLKHIAAQRARMGP